MIDRALGKTCLPKLLRNHEPPRAMALPLEAASKWPISEAATRSSNNTGKAPVLGLRAPRRSKLRPAARWPISAAWRKSL
jgi:hypothetical protein